MSYQKIKAVIEHAKEVTSLQELIRNLGEDPAFFYGKGREALIRRQRKQYIETCVKLGLLNENYQLTELGNSALANFNETLTQIIFNMDVNGRKFKDILFETLAKVDIPIMERIKEKMDEIKVDISIHQLRNYLNILANCGVLQKNRKYTYTLAQLNISDFETILHTEYNKMEKDPTGTVWFEQLKENIMKKYNLNSGKFDELLEDLRKRKPHLIGLQRARTKSWLLLREG